MMHPLSTNVQTSEAGVCDSNHANIVIDARFLHWCTFSIFENLLLYYISLFIYPLNSYWV